MLQFHSMYGPNEIQVLDTKAFSVSPFIPPMYSSLWSISLQKDIYFSQE